MHTPKITNFGTYLAKTGADVGQALHFPLGDDAYCDDVDIDGQLDAPENGPQDSGCLAVLRGGGGESGQGHHRYTPTTCPPPQVFPSPPL